MGLGNGNPKSGNKGSNYDYELKVLKLLEAIAVAVEGGGGGGITCDDLPSCQTIQDIETKLLTIESNCFSPQITVDDPDAVITRSLGQYQRVGNIVTCSVYFQIVDATTGLANLTIDVPIKDPSSDYTSTPGIIMGIITAQGSPNNWRNLDFFGGTTDGIEFFLRTTGTPTINSTYVAQFSYAYRTDEC